MKEEINLDFRFKALTDIWTGGVGGKSDKLHLTGIKGSLRWWYEALIRGLKCYACDPNDNNNRCSFELSDEEKKKVKEGEKSVEEYAKEKICPACYLFGCTGWSGKLILRIYNFTDDTKNSKQSELHQVQYDKITKGTKFILRFIETKNLESAELILINMTLKLIVDYGAISGKTVLKPPLKPSKSVFNSYKYSDTYKGIGIHRDFGIIDRYKNSDGEDYSNVSIKKIYVNGNKTLINNYLKLFPCYCGNDVEWPNIKSFWFLKDDYIDQEEYKFISTASGNSNLINWLKGDIVKSKKIFSFHGLDSYGKNRVFNSRCFGYAKVGELDNMINLIEGVVPTLKGKLIKGEDILDKL